MKQIEVKIEAKKSVGKLNIPAHVANKVDFDVRRYG